MWTSKSRRVSGVIGSVIVLIVMTVAAAAVFAAEAEEAEPSKVGWIKLDIKHRVHAQFAESVTVTMNELTQVGDTDYFFKITEFYPHFAMIDSTKEIVSLSNELKNPAFKIVLYENEELSEETWAFFAIKVPHFARNSYLAFDAVAFEYDGAVYGDDGKGDAAKSVEQDAAGATGD